MRTLAPLALVLTSGLMSCQLGLDFTIRESSIPTDDSEGDADTDADGDGDADSDADADADADGDIEILRVIPEYGTTAGGQTVVIAGGPFDASAEVYFGSGTATVTDWADDELTVSTPTASSEGAVDVYVTTTADSGRSPSAFYYFEDGSGMAGAIGEVALWNLVGSFWKPPTTFGSAWVTFVMPVDFHIWEWYAPTIDTCADASYTYTGNIYVRDIGASTITIRPASGTASTLAWYEDDLQYSNGETDLTATQVPANTTFALDAVHSSDFIPFSVSQLARTPASFTITSPAVSGSVPATVSRNSFNLQWTGSGGDRMLIQGLMLNAARTGVDGWAQCVVTDDGSFTIPPTAWTSWTSGRYIQLNMVRASEQGGTIEYDNSESRVLGEYVNIALLQAQ
ncbi:MAG: IPT/TIG domain-containing protein [Pseudomonadota bacterium]